MQVWIGPQNGLNFLPQNVNSTAATIAAPSGVTGQIIRVYKIFLVVGGATNITFQDGSTALCGALPMLANGAISLPNDGTPWFTTSSGNAFNIANSGGAQVSGIVYYTINNA